MAEDAGNRPSNTPVTVTTDDLVGELARLRTEVEALRSENERLRRFVPADISGLAAAHQQIWSPSLFGPEPSPATLPPITAASPLAERLGLLRSLFRPREDVYAHRWEGRNGRTGWSPVYKGGFAGRRAPKPEYLPLTDDALAAHVEGQLVIGIYPLLQGDRTGFVAVDFDKGSWALDALAYVDAARQAGVPTALEVSRSGRGGHVWTFFSRPVTASDARELAAGLLRRAMDTRAEIDLSSYDRLFPSQDTLPKGGFGNLIALPLQGACAASGTTLFLDPSKMQPWPDQWEFLAGVSRLDPQALASIVRTVGTLEAGPSVARHRIPRDQPPPEIVRSALGPMLTVDTSGLPVWLRADLKHLASLHNPEFHQRQRLRLSTWRTPRLVRCYEEEPGRLHLPRGLVERVENLLDKAGSKLELDDQRPTTDEVDICFRGSLTSAQESALERLMAYDRGVLTATTGSGKTVIACAAIARRRVPTLVLVDRGPLLDQWKTRLGEYLDIPAPGVGQIGGGRSKPGGVVDIAMLQTLARRDNPHELFDQYGQVIIDECHHLASPSFDAAVRHAASRFWLGLTATPYRSDGLEDIVHFQCGPTRATISRKETAAAALRPRAVIHDLLTDPGDMAPDEHIQEVFRRLVQDEERNMKIVSHVVAALDSGRHCMVLSQWTQHLEIIEQRLQGAGRSPLVLKGGMGKKARAAVLDELTGGDGTPTLLLATGSFLGEGFDCPHLDTLFLAFPIRFRGRVEQYVGRVMRASPGKWSVEIHDYFDSLFPQVRRMYQERLDAYDRLGVELPPDTRRRRPRRSGLQANRT